MTEIMPHRTGFREVPLDDDAPHQIRLFTQRNQRVQVGCTCRKLKKGFRNQAYVSFGFPASTREAKAMYNDLSKHDQTGAPFTTGHMLEER